jgi:hypothetical protein
MRSTQQLLDTYTDTVLTREVKPNSRAAYHRRLTLALELGVEGLL